MLARSLVVVAMLTGPAVAEFDLARPRDIETAAETPRLRIGQPGAKLALDKVAVSIEQDALALTANVTLTVSTTDNAAREATIALEVPHGARITGVALTIGKTERMIALASSVERAALDYQRVLDYGKDPVLVQWKSTSAAGDQIEVRAFPLTTKERGRIELTIELPAIPALTIDTQTASALIMGKTHRQVREPITIELPARRELDFGLTVPRPHVNATTSFYAGFAPSGQNLPSVTFGPAPRRYGPFSPDKAMIRRQVKRRIAQLQHCYERAYQYNPLGGPDADAVLHFTIDTTGKIADTSISGTIEDPAITSCLAGVIAQLEFSAGESATQVNYPLHFRLNR